MASSAVKTVSPKSAAEMARTLCAFYKNAHYYLDFKTPIDLLVAATISAQTRDETVNRITPALFRKYKSASDYAHAEENELVAMIKSVSFASNKAKNIIEACKTIERDHRGKVPNTMDDLIALPGIGRKTANTILINAFGKVEGIPVDTWVIKLSSRLGLSDNKNPEKIEADLMKSVPKQYWDRFAYVLKAHGKSLCGTVPICSKCPIDKLCPRNGVAKAT